MIGADTSSWIAFLQGDAGEDVDLLDWALESRQVVMPPPVLTELLSDPKLPADTAENLRGLPLMPIREGVWERAGGLRAKVLAKRRKARLGDALIAQVCIDNGISLITRDSDFRAFAQAAGLNIAIET